MKVDIQGYAEHTADKVIAEAQTEKEAMDFMTYFVARIFEVLKPDKIAEQPAPDLYTEAQVREAIGLARRIDIAPDGWPEAVGTIDEIIAHLKSSRP